VDRERDFAGAFDAALAKLRVEVQAACRGQDRWDAGVAAAIRRVLEFAVSHPAESQTLTGGAFEQGVYGMLRYRRMIEEFAELLAAGREGSEIPESLSRLLEEALVGGVAEIIGSRLRSGREQELPDLAAELAELVLTPYVGAAEARRLARAKS
jgi:hypothetical protein